MTIPIGLQCSIRNGDRPGHRVVVQDDRAASGGFLVQQWWEGSEGPNVHAAFDDWVENEAVLGDYLAESGWEIACDTPVDLHDATLLAMHIVWAEGSCLARLRHGVLGECVLAFSALSFLELPRKQLWGPSASIAAFGKDADSEYRIDLQSGDCIRIRAADAALRLPSGELAWEDAP